MLDFIKKYLVYIIAGLLVIVFLRSCGKSRSINRLEKVNISNVTFWHEQEATFRIQGDLKPSA